MNQANTVKESTLITLAANPNKANELTALLQLGGKIVQQTEPETKAWFALRNDHDRFYIFDAFLDENGRTAHFNGKVAQALHENATLLVKNGWQDGVLANISNAKILSAKLPTAGVMMKIANYITFEAKPEKAEAVTNLLQGAAQLVQETEPETIAWFALQMDETKFAVFDAFANAEGQAKHFSGQVAGILKEKSATTLLGGWEQGVVNNIQNLHIISHQ